MKCKVVVVSLEEDDSTWHHKLCGACFCSLATAPIFADEHAAQLLAAVQASKQLAAVVAAVVPRLLVVDASSEHDGEEQQLPSDGARMLSTGAGGALDLPVGSNFVRMTRSILEGLLMNRH